MRFQPIPCDGEDGLRSSIRKCLRFLLDDSEKLLRLRTVKEYPPPSKINLFQFVRRGYLVEYFIEPFHGGNILRSAYQCPVLPLSMTQQLRDTGSVKDMDMDNTLIRTTNEPPEQTVTSNDHEVDIELGASPTGTAITKRRYRKGNCNNLVLLIAAVLTFLTFHAGLNPPVTSYSGAVFLWLNSAVFVASEAMIAFLARELPLSPWLLVSVFSLFGTYVCSIITTFPHTALTVLCAGSPLLVFAAASGHTIN